MTEDEFYRERRSLPAFSAREICTMLSDEDLTQDELNRIIDMVTLDGYRYSLNDLQWINSNAKTAYRLLIAKGIQWLYNRSKNNLPGTDDKHIDYEY